MGIFDFLHKKTPEEIRGYKIHSLQFCEVGKNGKRETAPGKRFFTDSRYIMPLARMTVLREGTVTIKVRIIDPSLRTHTYDFEAPLTCNIQDRECQFPWWGSEEKDKFNKTGRWTWEIYDSDDNLIIRESLTISTLDDLWEEQGWIHVTSRLEFADSNSDGKLLTPWGYGPFVQPHFIMMRLAYEPWCKETKTAEFDAIITNLQNNERKVIKNKLTIRPQRGYLIFCGFGSDSGKAYPAGKYSYEVEYKGKRIAQSTFTVDRSPADKGWIEPHRLVIYAFNTEDEMQKWIVYDVGMTIAQGGSIEQPAVRRGVPYHRMVAGLQWKSLDGPHNILLTFRYFIDGQKLADFQSNATVYDPDDPETDVNLFKQNFEVSHAIRDDNGHPLPPGRYTVKVYVTGGNAKNLYLTETSITI